ncbi:MAG: ABC transporter permease [Lachnospiraceae bacterium]|nr:ABC transporter permease [Lachnospiraceae bacterium]
MNANLIQLFWEGTQETLYMVLLSMLISYLIGTPLGAILYVTDGNGICKNTVVNTVVGAVINMIRSIPFLILLVAILPFTRLVVGTTIGAKATIVPLVAAASPYVARMVESSLKEVDAGVIEAAQAMGSSTLQIISKVILPEAKPSLLVGVTISFATILGYSAMAGFCGGGGLGAIAVNYGYYRYDNETMLITVVLLVLIVQFFQEIGSRLVKRIDKRIK